MCEQLQSSELEITALEDCETEDIIYMNKKIDSLFKSINSKKPPISAKNLMIKIDVDLILNENDGFCFTEPKLKLESLLSGDRPVSLEEFAIPQNSWLCVVCRLINQDKDFICEKCNSFRLLESYPNLLDNPLRVTKNEIQSLKSRREKERWIICGRDTLTKKDIQMDDCWYLISSKWLSQWKAFVFNKPSNDSIISTNSAKDFSKKEYR